MHYTTRADDNRNRKSSFPISFLPLAAALRVPHGP
jgi:hypothetical protein